MATESVASATTNDGGQNKDKRPRSIFELPASYFDSCRLLPPGKHSFPAAAAAVDETLISTTAEDSDQFDCNDDATDERSGNKNSIKCRLSCNTCKSEFDSLLDQRSHFKSDFHRFNMKLSLAGKDVLKEDDLDELTSDSFSKDFDVSSISGSEDEDDRASRVLSITAKYSSKQKIFVCVKSGEKVSVWKSLLLKDSETVSSENDQFVVVDAKGTGPCLREVDVIEKLKALTQEPRDNTHFRVVLLASGGHFAGCVFDGNTVVAHKTAHRYVVRAKAGKSQASKDGSGKSIHSAGASLRRYNELALKKNVQELLASWKPYFDASSCVFIYAPSNNHQLFYNGETPLFSDQHCDVKSIPFTVRRPTFKEARRINSQLSQVNSEVDEEELLDLELLELYKSSSSNKNLVKENVRNEVRNTKENEACESPQLPDEQSFSCERDTEVIIKTSLLHEAANSGDVDKVSELLEQGHDPTLKDERGRTPYMVATDKEVRNTFRRFMASNLEKWDWHAANVPSPLTKEMEETQAAKQAEKDAKRKAKAKEVKKLRKEREKKAQAKAAEAQKASSVSRAKSVASSSNRRSVPSEPVSKLSKEEELKRQLAEEREKRAAAAEKRIAMAAAAAATATASSQVTNNVTSSTSQPPVGISSEVCTCCSASLVGKIPFHRYNYKYCSTTCMKVHKEFLEDG